jgi:hypothetical protein
MQPIHPSIRPAGVDDHERPAELGGRTVIDRFGADHRPEDLAA